MRSVATTRMTHLYVSKIETNPQNALYAVARTQQLTMVAQSIRTSTKIVNFNLQTPGANTPLIPKN
jgi:hypothetical protein